PVVRAGNRSTPSYTKAEDGTMGAQGSTATQGSAGETGSRGPQGEKGDPGPAGPQGLPGGALVSGFQTSHATGGTPLAYPDNAAPGSAPISLVGYALGTNFAATVAHLELPAGTFMVTGKAVIQTFTIRFAPGERFVVCYLTPDNLPVSPNQFWIDRSYVQIVDS